MVIPSGKTATLDGPDHIDAFDLIEHFNRQLLTNSLLDLFAIHPELTHIPLRFTASLGEQFHTGG